MKNNKIDQYLAIRNKVYDDIFTTMHNLHLSFFYDMVNEKISRENVNNNVVNDVGEEIFDRVNEDIDPLVRRLIVEEIEIKN